VGPPQRPVTEATGARRQTFGLATVAAIFGGLALIAPIWPAGGVVVEPRVGLLWC
jgi:hypothetical protein